MQTISNYLNFMGNTEEAMNFYKSVLGGEFTSFTRFGDTPFSDKMPPEDRNKIMNITLRTKNGSILMATDYLESMEQKLLPGNNMHLVIHPDSEEEADTLFQLLSNGGKAEMPMDKTFWGTYFGECIDKYAVSWMLMYFYPPTNKPV